MSVSLGLNCSRKGTSEATTVLSLKASQMLTSSPEGLRLHGFFFSPPPHLLHSSVTSTTYPVFARRLMRKQEERRIKEGREEVVEHEKGGAHRYNAWLELQSSRVSDASTELLISRPISSPPSHLPSFLKPQIGSCHGSTTVSACHEGGEGPDVMRSDRVLFENPVQIGH